MARGLRAELTEALNLLDCHLRIAGEVEQRIEQHRAVAGGQHETVAVRPVGCGGVELKEKLEQNPADAGPSPPHSPVGGLPLPPPFPSPPAESLLPLAL